MKKRGWSANPIDMILFTHYHADHISGLPGMLLSMANAERKDPVIIAGPRGLENVVNSLRVIAPGLPFEIRYHELTQPQETILFPGEKEFIIRAFKVQHRVTCYGYTLELLRIGKFQPEKARELGLPVTAWGKLQHGASYVTADGRTILPEQVLGPSRKGLKLTYTTDTRPCPQIIEAAEGADLFICEGMYGDDEKKKDAESKKHMTFTEAARLAAAAKPVQLWLTHYSPSLVHPEEFIESVRKIFPESIAARDGRSVTLKFEEEADE